MKRLLRRAVTRLYTRFPALVDRWVRRHPVEERRDVPWTPFEGELARARLGVVTTAGVHLVRDEPFDMDDSAGDPSWRVLPTDARREELTITHESYDVRDALADLDVVYPVHRLQELADAGFVGALVDAHAGLMGHVEGRHLTTLVERTAPEVARHFRDQRADLVLLAPA